jgi:hypothetical protein
MLSSQQRNHASLLQEDNMKKWEYCLLTEIWITEPYSTSFKLEYADPATPTDFITEGMTLVEVLAHLGQDGWEAVNMDAESVENGAVTKILLKRKINTE